MTGPSQLRAGGISSALAALMAGCGHAFLPRYTPAALLAALQAHRVSATTAVPTMLSDLVQAARDQQARSTAGHTSGAGIAPARDMSLPCVRRILVGAGPVPAALAAQAAGLMPNAQLFTAYGMTECASSITLDCVRPLTYAGAAPERRPAGQAGQKAQPRQDNREGVCVGAPAPGTQVAILPLPPKGFEAAGMDAQGHRQGALQVSA